MVGLSRTSTPPCVRAFVTRRRLTWLFPDVPDRLGDAGVSFGVLGPLTVTRAGAQVDVGGHKERLVLAHLLARANVIVSVDALVEGVWGGHPPRSAERTLQAYVARLRRVLEPDRSRGAPSTVLLREGGGYRVRIDSGHSDALRFEALARRGADQLRRGEGDAASVLREALALWRGPPYVEFGDVDACAAEARRLCELHVVALEDRMGADLAAGATSELVAELEALVAEHPFRERLWAQLMLALYRSGRQRDALVAYQRSRAVLTEQVGIEPGPDLRQLEAAILEQDPKLDLAHGEDAAPGSGLPLPLEAVGPAFVGRDPELAFLRSAWADAAEGRGGFVSVLGPEGIGKTRLVAELAREVHQAGAVVLYGRCDHAHRGARALLDQTLRSGGSSLSRVEGGETPLADLAGAVVRFLVTWSQERPLLLALDDLHLADADTLEVIADLAGWAGAAPMLVVAAFHTQSDAPFGSPPEARETAAQVALRGLDRDAVGRLCALYDVEGWTSDDVTRLHELTGGVPLQVHEQASEWARQRAARHVEEAADRSTVARVRLASSRGEIADSVESIQRLLEQRRANLSGREAELGPAAARSGPPLCPYKGLVAFEEADAAEFFGRERLVAELVARLAGARLLTVVGPSGSGKSSLVQAGLLPALAAGVLPVTGGGRSVILTPGARPAQTLAHRLAVAGWPSGGHRAVFIDQFEEVFTLCRERAEQAAFVEQVVSMADRADTAVVLAIRADQLGRCAALPALADLITGNNVLVAPMSDAELRRAIELPARRAGLTLEAGLLDVILADVAGGPGTLPLLSTALAETWERRSGRTLTLAGYHAAGGVSGALARLAEDAYQGLGPDARIATRRLLVRLCDTGDDGRRDLRRRLPLADVAAEGDDHAHAGLEALVERRLLVVDRDTIEVAHEALLREWPRLRSWLDDDAQGRLLHRRVTEAARAWRRAEDDPSELYRGARLGAALEWAATHDADLNDTERAFIAASQQEAAHELDNARRQAAERGRAIRRLRALTAGMAMLVVVASASGWLFLRQRDRAENIARVATAHELAGEASRAVDEDPQLAILLGLEALRASRAAGQPPQSDAVGALQQAMQASRVELRRDEGAVSVDASRDGTLLVTSSADLASVLIWDAVTAEKVRTLAGPGVPVSSVSFSPDGRLIAATYDRSMAEGPGPAVIVWEATAGEEVARLAGPAGVYGDAVFSADGRLLAAASSRTGTPSRVTEWDVPSATELFSFEPAGGAFAVAFVPEPLSLAVAEPNGERIGFYSSKDGHELDGLATPGFAPESSALDPTGRLLAVASQTSLAVQVWDLQTRRRVVAVAVGDAGPVDWSPRGDRLAIAGANQGAIRIIDVASGKDAMVLRGHDSGSWDVTFIGDGARLASVGVNGGLRIWDVTADGPPAIRAQAIAAGRPQTVQLSPDGAEMIVSTRDGIVERLDTATGEVLASVAGQKVGLPSFYPVASRDGHLMASLNDTDGRAVVRDQAAMTAVQVLPECASPTAFSPDGSLLVLDGRAACTSMWGVAAEFQPSAGAEMRSRVIEVGSGREVLDLGEQGALAAAFNPEGRFSAGRYLAVSLGFEVVDIFDVQTGALLASFSGRDLDAAQTSASLLSLAFDPKGRWLTGGTTSGRAWVLDLAAVVTGETVADALLVNQIAHEGAIPRTALSEDGVLATVGFGDGLIRLWDIFTKTLLLELRTDPTGTLSPVEFTPDGRYLLYADGDVLRRYVRDTDELIGLAQRRLTRGFTADECRRYLDPTRCP